MVPLGNSTDSSLLSLGIDIMPTTPIIAAAITTGIRICVRVAMKRVVFSF
jgi:hypothetical protein